MLSEKAKSRAQQRFFGMVRAAQKGEMENPSSEIIKVASTVSKSDVKKMASTKHKGLPEKKKVEEAAFLAGLAKAAVAGGKGMIKQKAKQVVKQKAVNVAQGAIPQPNRDHQESVDVQKTEDQAQKKMNQIKKQVLLKKLQAVRSGGGETVTASYKPESQMTEGAGRAAIGAGLGAIVGGPVGAAIGGSIGAAMGKKKKKVTTGGKKVKKTATNFFKAEPKVTRSEGVLNMVRKGLERDKKAKVEKKIKDRKAVPYAALAAEHQPEGDMVEGKEEGGYISNAAKAEVRNQRRFGKKGSATPQGYFGQKPSEKAQLAVQRGEEHKSRRGVKTKGAMEEVKVEGEQLDELNKRERVEAGQGKRAAKKGDWSKQKASTGRRNINRFETKPVEREEGSLNKGKQSFKKVKVLNPKSGYSKKGDATTGSGKKITSRKLSPSGTDLKPDYGPQKPHWAGNVHSDRAQEQRRSEHKARRGVKTKGTVAADIKKSLKDDVSIVDKMLTKYLPETYFDTNRRGISTKGGFVKQYNKPGKLSRASLNHERKSKNPELRMSKKELRTSMIDDANYEKKMGRSKPTPSNLKTALKKQSANEQIESLRKIVEEVGISSSAAMEKARKEAQLQAKEDAKVAEKKKKKPVVEGSAYGLWKGDGKRKLPGDKKKKQDVKEAKVDAGKSPEEKEKDRNVRKFGVSHNVAGHGKLRRALHRSNRGDKKIPGDKSQYVETEAYRVLAKDKTDLGRPAVFSYKDEKDAKKFADSIKSKGGKATVHKEGVMDIVKRYRKKQKAEKKPSMDATTKKLHKWRKDKEHSEREKYVSPFRPIDYD